jgi:hypothetical protein
MQSLWLFKVGCNLLAASKFFWLRKRQKRNGPLFSRGGEEDPTTHSEPGSFPHFRHSIMKSGRDALGDAAFVDYGLSYELSKPQLAQATNDEYCSDACILLTRLVSYLS